MKFEQGKVYTNKKFNVRVRMMVRNLPFYFEAKGYAEMRVFWFTEQGTFMCAEEICVAAPFFTDWVEVTDV